MVTPPANLVLAHRAKRITLWLNVVVLLGVSMTMIVFADNNNWAVAWSLAVLFGYAVYLLGTAAFSIRYKAPGKVEVYSILGILKLDVHKGYTVKQGHFGRATVVVKSGKKRYRLNGALGSAGAVESWLNAIPR